MGSHGWWGTPARWGTLSNASPTESSSVVPRIEYSSASPGKAPLWCSLRTTFYRAPFTPLTPLSPFDKHAHPFRFRYSSPLLPYPHAHAHTRTCKHALFCAALGPHQTQTRRPAGSARPTQGGSRRGTAPPSAKPDFVSAAPSPALACVPRGCAPPDGAQAAAERHRAVQRAHARRSAPRVGTGRAPVRPATVGAR